MAFINDERASKDKVIQKIKQERIWKIIFLEFWVHF
jgi:hypothetical protein